MTHETGTKHERIHKFSDYRSMCYSNNDLLGLYTMYNIHLNQIHTEDGGNIFLWNVTNTAHYMA